MESLLQLALPARFEEAAARFANRVALKRGQSTLTYESLNRAANRLAHALLIELGSEQEPVALLADQSLSAVIGILGVHLWGKPCDVEALSQIAAENGLALFFDAAHAFGCSHRGRMIGSFGRLEVFSFHATKFFHTFEGGAITTNDDDLAQKIRLMRNFGFLDYDQVIELGTNGKLNEISAAMGLNLLDCLDDVVAANYRNYHQYEAELDGLPGIELLKYGVEERSNYQYIVVKVNEEGASLSRDQLVSALWAENVLARRYFYPGCHRMEPYASEEPGRCIGLPVTEDAVERFVALPSGAALGPAEIGQICQILRFVLENGPAVREKLVRSGWSGFDPRVQ